MGIRSRYEELKRYELTLYILYLKRTDKVSDYVIVCSKCKKKFQLDKSYPFETALQFLLKSLETHRCSKNEVSI